MLLLCAQAGAISTGALYFFGGDLYLCAALFTIIAIVLTAKSALRDAVTG